LHLFGFNEQRFLCSLNNGCQAGACVNRANDQIVVVELGCLTVPVGLEDILDLLGSDTPLVISSSVILEEERNEQDKTMLQEQRRRSRALCVFHRCFDVERQKPL
jgi:hypothetical protein